MQERVRIPRPARAGRMLGTALSAIAIVLGAGCDDYDDQPLAPPPAGPQATVLSATGDIAAKVAEFRALLGEPANGGTAGQQPAGRREIAWDGGAANPFNNRNDFPADFFNTTAKNGAVFTTPGSGFRNDSLKFGEVDASYAAEFSTFSPTKIFAPVGSNVTDLHLRVAGAPTPAAVTGFGIVFADVDLAGSAKIELFDEDGVSLGVFLAPVRSDAAGLSFIGARFDEPIVARVRITTGTGALGAGVKDVSAGGALDLVVMDNLIYGEPQTLTN